MVAVYISRLLCRAIGAWSGETTERSVTVRVYRVVVSASLTAKIRGASCEPMRDDGTLLCWRASTHWRRRVRVESGACRQPRAMRHLSAVWPSPTLSMLAAR